jgi:hypothetical protein
MGPENTNCEVIDTLHLSSQQLQQEILTRTFRIQEELRISNYSSPGKFQYRSCNGQTGFLLTFHADTVFRVFTNVPVSLWQELSDAEDPREHYSNIKNSLISLEE